MEECEFSPKDEDDLLPILPDRFLDDKSITAEKEQSKTAPLIEKMEDDRLPKLKSFADRFYLEKVVDYCQHKIDQIFEHGINQARYRIVGFWNSAVWGLPIDQDPYRCNFQDAFPFDPSEVDRLGD